MPQNWGDQTTNRPAGYNSLCDKYARVVAVHKYSMLARAGMSIVKCISAVYAAHGRLFHLAFAAFFATCGRVGACVRRWAVDEATIKAYREPEV
jgi:hypothetical protein